MKNIKFQLDKNVTFEHGIVNLGVYLRLLECKSLLLHLFYMGETAIMKTTVRQLLRAKGNALWTINPESTVFEALQLMADKDVGALLVMKENKLVGIFSERDYARKGILKGKSSKDTSVGELMTKEVFYVSPDNSIEECMALMSQKHIRHLPVMEEGQVVGMLSIGDVVKKLISDQSFTIQQLEKYISGDYGV